MFIDQQHNTHPFFFIYQCFYFIFIIVRLQRRTFNFLIKVFTCLFDLIDAFGFYAFHKFCAVAREAI